MKTWLKSWIVRMLVLMMAAPAAIAQDRVPFRQEELDQMLAPIALYPDPLLSQVLMASTYPLEVVQASRWSRANPGLKGQEAVRAAGQMDWDPSVQSLAAFPQVLAMMDDKIEWTERLGEAFLAQPEDVMDSVQALRRRADAAGNLLSSEQMRVARQGPVIAILPPGPEIVYVPYYDPMVVYGPWWYPAYPPVFWAAPSAYYVIPARRPGFYWSSGIVISAGFFFGHTDWQRRRVTVVHNHVTNVTVNRTTVINPPAASRTRTTWQHDPAHRRGAPFRNAEARQRYEQSRSAVTATTRTAAPSPSTDDRQRGVEERRKAARDRSENRRVERREPEPVRAAPTVSGNRSSATSDGERAKPPVRREVQRDQAERQAQRPSPQPAQPRAERQAQRTTPQPEQQRVERREAPRPQPRAVEPPRPAVVAPQPQRAPQAAPPRAENRGNGNRGAAAQNNPAGSGAPRQQAGPRSNGDHSKGKGDRGGKRKDD
jgi:hypothetical protein